MARKSTLQAVEPIAEELGAMTLEATTEEAKSQQLRVIRENELADIDQQFALAPYERARVAEEIRFYLNRSCEAMLEAGRRLVQAKENEPVGQWLGLLNDINIAPRTAQQLMQAAVKFTGGARAKLADLGRTKLLDLMVEDDDDLDALADGGTIAGLTLDDVDKMTSRELRQKLREERLKKDEEREVLEKMLADKSKKIDQLDMALAKKDKVTKRDTEAALQAQIKAQSAAIEYAATQTLNGLLDLQKLAREIEQNAELPEELLFAATQALDRIQHRINDMRSGMAVLPDMSPIEDDWVTQAEQAGIA